MIDRQTAAFYRDRGDEWAAALPGGWSARLDRFLDRLPPGAQVLELGCGDGRDAMRMIERGFSAHPTDGVAEMAAMAAIRLGRPVRVMAFDELDAACAFDAVWANASLLHVPLAELAPVIARIADALKPGGQLGASFKAGQGGGRDGHGRFYNYLSRAELLATCEADARWRHIEIEETMGGSFGGKRIPWLNLLATRR